MSVSFKPVRSLLQTGTSTGSRWLSYVGLGIGVLLLFCAVQMLINIHQLLKGNIIHKNGYDYISVTKKITLENIGDIEKTFFNQQDVDELRAKPFINDVAPLMSSQFQLEMIVPDVFAAPTTLYLESLRTDFVDTVPPGFQWHKSSDTIPLILSSQFFEVFNALARSNGLLQLTPVMATTMPIKIVCHGYGDTVQTFEARLLAFSDRINTVLAPKEFIDWANLKFSGEKPEHFSRLYLKTKDADNRQLLNFLDSKNYKVNKDKTKLGGTKQVLQGIFTGLGVFGLLVVVLALMLFSFYLQLVIAKSRNSLQLLLDLGYSPKWMSKNLSKRFIPVYISIILLALACTEIMQCAFHQRIMFNRSELSSWLHWSVALTALFLAGLSIITNYTLVKKILKKLG